MSPAFRHLATAAVLACAIALGACATRPSEPGAPPLTPSPDILPNFVVPDARARMVFLARQEWTLFGSPVVTYAPGGEPVVTFEGGRATHEVQGDMLSRVMVYWYDVTRLPIVGRQGELQPWSAAFIAWLAKSAGLAPAEFPRTVRHWTYIERFLQPDAAARFVARDPKERAPAVGDLVCNARNSYSTPGFADAVTAFSQLTPGPYHCDLVVATSPGLVEIIGGNVSDVVSLSRLETDANGLLRDVPGRPWVAVLVQRDPR